MIVEELDWRAPLEAFAPLVGKAGAHILHAGAKADCAPGACSVIVAAPTRMFEIRNGRAMIDGEVQSAAPLDVLRGVLEARRYALTDVEMQALTARGLAPSTFLGGGVGYFGYELGALIEPQGRGPVSPHHLADATIGFYNAAAIFDREAERVFVVGRSAAAVAELDALLAAAPGRLGTGLSEVSVRASHQATEYMRMVEQVREAILDGALFQANVAQRLFFEARADDMWGAAFSVFENLSALSSAHYGGFFQFADGCVVSDSPERFFEIAADERRIVVSPIKGTRPRGRSAEEDAALAQALQDDIKDRAENIMIADLMRNDLSRLCEDATISEDRICALESYANVHHLVSEISGRLAAGVDFVDCLTALFPCGSITGAPKIEAMRHIGALEKVGRGPYCGALGVIDDRGGAKLAVAIRTMVAEAVGSDRVRFTAPVGGGVTLGSSPIAEYEETLAKAQSFFRVFGFDREAML